jgi:hypothetical protein
MPHPANVLIRKLFSRDESDLKLYRSLIDALSISEWRDKCRTKIIEPI